MSVFGDPENFSVYVSPDGELEDLQVRIVDSNGSIIKSGKVFNELRINVRQFKKGTYFLIVKNEDERMIKKLIIN